LPLFFIKPDVFFIIEALKFYIIRNTKCFYIGLFCLFFTSNIFSQTTVQGKILDEQGEGLLGANIIINGTSQGTVSDQNGNFNLTTSKDIPFEIEVSFIGFQSQNITVNTQQLGAITLAVENSFDEVIISASRRAKKLQEAPSAVSVITAKQVTESGGSLSPLRALINTPGVELQQQTGQRVNIALRGSSGVFSTSVFPMLDYRSLISPGLEFFDSQNSPINQIDVERVEVVLGPSSALYGPDVTSGVVHFISKDPFKHPGTTAELIYGERNTFKVAVRHGGHNTNETFGYKINARYGSGNDFTLDPDDPEDQAVLSNLRTAISRASITNTGNVNTDESGTKLFDITQTQIPGYWSAAANASLYFRPKNGMEVVTAGGWNAGKAIFYNDLGEVKAYGNEYWGQARFKYKGWFAQTYYIKNDGGDDSNPNYLNRTGLIVPLERSHYEAQIQYNFNVPTLSNSEWTVGLDYRDAKADTENHVYGRNEDNDDYTLYGAYAQAKFKLEPKLDLFLAGRYDGYNFTSEKTFSPRAALVFKPSTYHDLRFSFNQAANPLPASDLYFDLPIQTVPGVFDVWITGAVNPYTFGSNPQIDWLIPDVPNTPVAAGFPLAAAYAAVTGSVLEGLTAIAATNPSLAQLLPIVSGVLQDPTSAPAGFSPVVTTDTNGVP
jgi:iron complex outermembrane receptor protein